MKRAILLGMISILLSSPATYAREFSSKSKKPKYQAIQVYETSKLDQPFQVIGKIHVKGSNLKGLLDRMKRVASKQGADAVLNYKVENTASVSYWTGGQVSYADGIAIRFADSGIKEITSKTPIPVVE